MIDGLVIGGLWRQNCIAAGVDWAQVENGRTRRLINEGKQPVGCLSVTWSPEKNHFHRLLPTSMKSTLSEMGLPRESSSESTQFGNRLGLPARMRPQIHAPHYLLCDSLVSFLRLNTFSSFVLGPNA